MATHLDLEEQEQLDQLKHFWNRYGNLITSLALVGALAMAGWQGWQWWQRDQAAKAGGMYDELDRAVQAADVQRATRISEDLQSRYGSTAFAEQGTMLVAKLQYEKAQKEAARKSLGWVAEHAGEDEYRALARLRLAAVLLDDKQADEALKVLAGDVPKAFEALVADRRGDALQVQGKTAEAVKSYQSAYDAMDSTLDYRRLVEAKLIALGAPPAVAAAASGSGS